MPDVNEPGAPRRLDPETAPVQRRSLFKRHSHAGWILVIGAGAMVIAGFVIWQYYRFRESTDDAQVNGHLVPISARVGGYVEQVCVEENETVKAGSVLFRIDPADYQVAIQRAQAGLAQAQAEERSARIAVPITSTTTASRVSAAQAAANLARAGILSAQEEVAASRAQLNSKSAQLRQVEADRRRTSQDLERYRLLVAKDEIPRQRFDTAVAADRASQAAVDAARAVVTAAEQEVAVSQAHLTQARARLVQADSDVSAAQTAPQQIAATRATAGSASAKIQQMQAALDEAKLNLGYTIVKAPVDGVVGKKSVETGMTVQPGQPVLSLVPLNDIWVTANFKEDQLRQIHPRQKAIISVDTYGRSYHGYVESVAAATGEKFSLLPPENATGNYVKVVQRIPVRLRFEHGQDPMHLLEPGMSVTVTVFTR